MAFTSVKGGQEAIEAAEQLIVASADDEKNFQAQQVLRGARLLVDHVMGEAGVYAPDLAAIAIAQAEGDVIEAAFLLRAYRSTLPRIGYSLPQTGAEMVVRRRISSAFKDIPGGQFLGRTRDYTQRLLDVNGEFARSVRGNVANSKPPNGSVPASHATPSDPMVGFPKVVDALRAEGLISQPPVPNEGNEPFDITRDAPRFPAPRSARMQMLARGETGFLVALGYSSMRGFGAAHPPIAELRVGEIPVRIEHPITGAPITIGHVEITEVEAVNHASSGMGASNGASNGTRVTDDVESVGYTLGYGVSFGRNERKAIGMAIIDMSLDIPENSGPAADEEFVLQHCDALESSGFVEHLKLPHYVTFQAQLHRLRAIRDRRSPATEARP